MTDEQVIAIMAAILTNGDGEGATAEAIALFRQVRTTWRTMEAEALPRTESARREQSRASAPRWYHAGEN